MSGSPIAEGQENSGPASAVAREDYKRGVQVPGNAGSMRGGSASVARRHAGSHDGQDASSARARRRRRQISDRASTLGPNARQAASLPARRVAKNFAPYQQALAAHVPCHPGPRGSIRH